MKKIISEIAEAITGTKFEGNTFIAGGYVRDLVMKNENSDLDIAVALPQGGIQLASFLYEKGIATKPVIFEQFGTALAEIKDNKIEFVMTRNESYRSGNRKPVTSPGTLLEDIVRRDFTINSLVMDIMTGEILDLTGNGLNDIKNGIIRATSDPDFIFSDDPLRILRAVRFANRLQFKIEKSTAKGILHDASQLSCISWERKRDEFEKILLSQTPAQGIKLLYKYNLMQFLIPEVLHLENQLYLVELEKLPQQIEYRLAALLQILIPEPDCLQVLSRIIDRLKFSTRIRETVKFLVKNCQHYLIDNHIGKDTELYRLVYNEPERVNILLLYISAFASTKELKQEEKNLKMQIQKIESTIAGRKYPLNGLNIMQEFDKPEGKEIGLIKEKGLDIWLRNPELTKTKLLKILKADDPLDT